MKQLTKSALPPSCQHLVEEMQRIGFGNINELHVRGGLPVFDPKPRIIREILFTGAPTGRSRAIAADFNLKPEVVELFGILAKIGDGMILSLTVRDGLPQMVEMEDVFEPPAEDLCQSRILRIFFGPVL